MNKVNIFSIFAVIILLINCKKSDEFLGPNIDKVYGDFEIIDSFKLSQSNVDFANGGSITFSAEFAAYEDWNIRITGLSSGSYKEYTGTGDVINIEWKGTSSLLPVLQIENCIATLTVLGENYSTSKSLSIDSIKTNEGILVSDFENGVPASLPFFYQSGVNFFADALGTSPQGNSYFNAGGTVPWDYLIGLISWPAINTQGQTYYPLSTNQHEVYFNAMMRGDENFPSTFGLFKFYEDDNDDGVWTEGTDDAWITSEVFINKSSWELYSVAYDSLNIDGDAGNGVREPEKLLSVEYLLLIDPTKGEARGDLDYLIFTEGGPLQP